MVIKPLTLSQANALVARLHRHHKPTRGHRFSIGAFEGGNCVGAAIVGRPVARLTAQYEVAEVLRLVTDGSKNACSFLYGACARIAKEMGFAKIQTFILDNEPGVTLKAAGWKMDGVSAGGQWSHTAGPRRTDQPTCAKQRWVRVLNPVDIFA